MSAQAVSGNFQAMLSFVNTLTGTSGSAKSQVTQGASQVVVSPGTAAGQCNELWSQPLTLLANTPQTLDLTTLIGEGGRTVSFAAIKFFHVLNPDPVNPVNIYGQILGPPSAPTVTGTTSGSTITAGTYLVAYTWTNAAGETLKSPSTSVTTTGTQNISVVIPTLPTGATGANIYVSTIGGLITTATKQNLAPVTAGTTVLAALVSSTSYPLVATATLNPFAPWSNIPGASLAIPGGLCNSQQGAVIGSPLLKVNMTAAGWVVDSTHKAITFDPGTNAITPIVTFAGLSA